MPCLAPLHPFWPLFQSMALVKRTQSKIIILPSVTSIYRRLGIRIEILCRFLLDASGRTMGQILPLVAEDEWCSSQK